ncbi:uncharacterized protein LOC105916930 [Fundulus heteroclitus]|uniref:uncharacterized protein LOC105916930 n=1 Tax=Fundulus heteroclitus TaxID=8078 RepID=UPI00165A34A9|nr:uncharacterized protein LOC105916930 [Fundulus heteroclitus]
MAVSLTFLLILTLITGNDGALTMIPAKAGASVTIPCLYESQYRNHVKYLCEGYYWDSCSKAIKTNSQGSGKYSISDDKNQTIFSVTINHLTVENTDYWCAVDISRAYDVGQYFQLSITTDTPSLYVDNQEVTGFIGEDVTINCPYRTSGEMKWCKLGRDCVTGVSGSIDGTTVNINTKAMSVFSVTMKGLMPKSSGWYYCDNGNFQMPVHLTVTAKPTVAAPTTVTTTGEMTTEGQVQTTRENRSEVVKVLDHYAQRSFSVQLSLIIPLSLQIFIVAVSLLFLLILTTKLVKPWDSTASKLNEGEETYSVVIFSRTKALQVSAQTHLPSLETYYLFKNTYYWCAVEINGGSDVRQYFELSVTTDTPSLYVDNQEVTGFIGEDVTINCYYRTSGEMKWCKLGRDCVTRASGSIDGTTVNINTKEKSVFNVTMRGLMPKSSGWYYCDNGNFQMPVHLTVTAKPTAAQTTVTTAGEMTTEGQVQMTKEEKSEVL